MSKYRFNKGDIVVSIFDSSSGWVEEGEIVELGGEYWEEDNKEEREATDRREELNAITKSHPSGNGQASNDKMFREATEKEINYFKNNGLGSNVNNMPFSWDLPSQRYSLPTDSSVEEGKYYKVFSTIDDDFIMIGKALSIGMREGDNYRSDAIFISPTRAVKFQKNKRWCYKNETLRCVPAEEYEIEWLNLCIDKDKFMSKSVFNQKRHEAKQKRYETMYSEEEKLEKFPTHGWCSNPSREVRRYIFDNFNDNKMLRPGKMGIAWNNRSAWKIEGSSSYKVYSNEQLEKLLPTKTKSVCIDLETASLSDINDVLVPLWHGGITSGKSDYVRNWMEHVMDPSMVGINAERQGVLEDNSGSSISPHLRDYQIREMEMMKLRHEEGMRKAMFGYPGDRVLSAGMAILGHTHTPKKQDEFTQQDTVTIKSKKKKRTLIFS